MAEATMFLWVLAAAAGLLMFGEWLSSSGEAGKSRSHLPEPLLLTHLGMAAAGTLVWIVYLLVRSSTVAWTGFGLAAATVTLGTGLFVRWLPVRESPEVAESGFPVPVVAAHGAFATAIVVLTLLTALGVG